ncbi:hypothetical protein AAC03nite_07430 [Alicyclobacillus acidoterrestris]|uniref:sulfur carrier protein ThiS n=1 Tax=Alicyclobacillus suci TaxID=2816080 RepID=UPI00118F2116|nr:sulfur carrier protein ThiS [Alicyclobacillus suci]GEO24958.1 hypothetical protein AAC03nite_07430 [Alicyclobacillus acidoterrestris]
MKITVNGKSLEVSANSTVQQLVEQLDLGHERIAVEHNQHILEPGDFATATIEEGDTLEIVRFVGGG